MKRLIEIKVPESNLGKVASFLLAYDIKFTRMGLSFFIAERHFKQDEVRKFLDSKGVLYPV